jgi:hypothetical protein
MGMYDTVLLLDEESQARVACAAGHPQKELQTKDLDCNLDFYRVFRGRLFFQATRAPLQTVETTEEGLLKITTQQEHVPCLDRVTMVAYTSCAECDPVVYETGHSFCGVGVDTHQPWVEYELVFQDGLLVKTTPLRCTTREDVAKEMRGSGACVLPDDDRIAKKAIEQHRQDRK